MARNNSSIRSASFGGCDVDTGCGQSLAQITRSGAASINARIRFIRRIQIEHISHGPSQIDAHTAFIEAAIRRDVETGVARLHTHIEMTVSATQAAIKDALMRVFTAEPQRTRRRAPRKTSGAESA